MKLLILFVNVLLVLEPAGPVRAQTHQTDLLIIGGGASGTTAGIQAARMGVKTLIVEETGWLGGMLTAAGVSAIDGNHQLPSGLWGEFRQQLYDHYGGPKAVETGWVSNTLFEPSVGNQVLQGLVRNENNLSVWFNTAWREVEKTGDGWRVTVETGKSRKTIRARLLLDATELGDVLAAAGAAYAVGMDSRHDTGEAFAPQTANDVIQDLTYVVTLRDYGPGADKTIPRPAGYDAAAFACSCDVSDPAGPAKAANNCAQMMQYGRLPNGKYMINWPKCGNDIYLNLIEKSPAERQQLVKEAKLHTLRFLYYLQTELGYKHLGIAAGEYPTADGLPMMPYHRESRRVKGRATLTLNHVARPYEQADALYRTGIAVGDYPIDHHHAKNPAAPAIDFIRIRVPAYNVPLGALVPAGVDGLIVAEKSISVTNIVNGATRLQPVVLQLGQAAGALAGVCIRRGILPGQAAVRDVQRALLDAGAYLMPFIDVPPADRHFKAVQRIGATGLLQGTGVPYKWANQTWFYPERPVSEYELATGLVAYYPAVGTLPASGKPLTVPFLADVFKVLDVPVDARKIAGDWERFGLAPPAGPDRPLDRRAVAVLLDAYLNPFDRPVDFSGKLLPLP
jgi:hypothetical protein